MMKRSIVMKTTDMQNTTIQSAAAQNSNMLNKLHMAMIELYKGDAKRIQHFCKVHSYARLIAQMENMDEKTLFTIETAALTHDIGIHICEEKYGECGGRLQLKVNSKNIEHFSMRCMSYIKSEQQLDKIYQK